MTPEELEQAKKAVTLAPRDDIDWFYQATIERLCAHIDTQAAQILSLRGSMEDMELISDAYEKKAKSQIEALKDKLAEERAKILMAGEDEVAEAWEYLKDNPNFINDAYQQLKADPDLKKAGVEWE